MTLTDEMRRLSQDFLKAYDDRSAAVAGICNDTAQELAGFRAAQAYMAADQRERLTNYMNGLRDNVSTFLTSLNATHEQMAIEQRQRLSDHVDQLRKNVGIVMQSLNTTHEQMAADQRQRLGDYMNGLRDNVTTIMKSLDTAHKQMSTEQRQRLAEGRANLTSDVNATRGDLQADHKEARKTWNTFNSKMQKHRSQKPASQPKSTGSGDDFTTITGIGPSFQKRLNDGGICTFAQLAASTPAKIRKALGSSGNLAGVEQWIKEARKHS